MVKCGSLSGDECYNYPGCMYSYRTKRCKIDPLHEGRTSSKKTVKRKTATKRRSTVKRKACPAGSRKNRSTGRCKKIATKRRSTVKRKSKRKSKRQSKRQSTKRIVYVAVPKWARNLREYKKTNAFAKKYWSSSGPRKDRIYVEK